MQRSMVENRAMIPCESEKNFPLSVTIEASRSV
jgi:hypothetical protein